MSKSNLAYLPNYEEPEPEFDEYDGDDEGYDVEECEYCGNKTFQLRQIDLDDEEYSFYVRQCANLDCGEVCDSVYMEYELEDSDE